jgi:hypothetical protein
MNPELGELLQQDSAALPAVDVRHRGPIQAQILPARDGYSRTVSVTNVADSLEIIPADPRRAYVTFYLTGSPCYIGHDKQAVLSGIAGILPVQRDLTLYSTAPIYILCTNAGPAAVSYWVGQWAD